MSFSMYQASVPAFVQGLTSLTAILDKAVAHAAARKIDPAVLLQARLFPDMLPMIRQVQIAADFAKNTPARLAGVEPTKVEDGETSFEELGQRLARTLDLVQGFTPAQIDGSEDREIVLTVAGNKLTFTGQTYLVNFALPNFWFHLTTAYALLRHNGVELGKRDFIGKI